MSFSSSLPVAISGMGSISCNGIGTAALWNAVLENHSSIENGLGSIPSSMREKLNDLYPEASIQAPAVIFAYASAKMAMLEAGWSELQPTDGLILATTTGQITAWEDTLLELLKTEKNPEKFSTSFQHQALGLTLKNLALLLNAKGPTLLLTSACSAGTQALAMAAAWIQTGKVKRCLVGGSEVLSTLTVQGFKSLQLLSEKTAKPFDQNRSGINLSEGAAFFCFENESSKPLAYLSGYGFSTDAYHLASPHPEGSGSYLAMQNALKKAKLFPSQIDWVHAHGTGSKANDQAEGFAIHRLFSSEISDKKTNPWVSSTKHIHGHALGASGAIEAAICIKSLQSGIIPKTAGLEIPDPEIHINHPKQVIHQPISHLLKNTLGFGGNNAALIFSHPNAMRAS